MREKRISVRIGSKLYKKLKREVSLNGRNQSQVVSEALNEYFARRPKARSFRKPDKDESMYEALKRLGAIGCVKNAPPDLSTNKKYFEGFGRD